MDGGLPDSGLRGPFFSNYMENMVQRKIFTVAEHTFGVVFPSGMDTGEAFVPYEPFADEAEEAPLFELEVMDGKAFHLSDTGDLDNLMDAAAYEEFCNK